MNRRGQGLIALAFLAPALLCLAVLRIVPAGSALVESFYSESLLRGGRVFTGLSNYTDLFSNQDFRKSVGVTLLFTIAQCNGTLDRVAHHAVRVCRGHRGVVPIMYFVLAASLDEAVAEDQAA